MRLDKLIENHCHTTRTQTKLLLKSRQVRVDNEIEINGSRNVDSCLHQIEIGGQTKLKTHHAYYLLNKPKGYVTAVKDAEKQTVLDLLAEKDRCTGLYPVGRLDRDTEGLVFLTDNGQLGYAMMQAKFHVDKIYEAVINARVTQEDVAAFAAGIRFLDGTICQQALLEILAAAPLESKVRLTINEGKLHQVKKMFLACGKKVVYLKRIQIGPLYLDEALQLGAYRPIKQAELLALKPFFK